jgi:GT2 family glycosyltransferase
MKNPKVSIIILNYNGWKNTINCLESVFNLDYSNFQVVVVDNGSKDNSIEYLRKWTKGKLKSILSFPDHQHFNSLNEIEKPLNFLEYGREESFINHVQYYSNYKETFICKSSTRESEQKALIIIDTKKNLGYAGGNNVGIRFSLNYLNADYIMILNNDTVVNSNLIEKLIEVFSFHEEAGIAGPLEYSYNEPYSIQSAGGRFRLYTGRHELLKNSLQRVKSVDWLIGCCMLIKKDLFYNLGYFDERYFLYVEEVDFAYRVKKGGYKTYITPETCIWHKGGKKGGKTFDELYDFYVLRNRLLFALKHLKYNQLLIFIPNHLKKVFTFSLRDLITQRQANFLKKTNAIKEAFLAYNKKIKNYNTVKEKK